MDIRVILLLRPHNAPILAFETEGTFITSGMHLLALWVCLMLLNVYQHLEHVRIHIVHTQSIHAWGCGSGCMGGRIGMCDVCVFVCCRRVCEFCFLDH